MASQEAIEARRSVIRGWLESGIKHGSIAVMIQTRFQVSRSTAYNEIGAVSQEITVSDDNAQDGNFTGNDPAIIDAESLLGQLQYQFDVATAMGDVKATCQPVKSMDTVRKWNGRAQEKVQPLQHNYS